MYSNEQLIKILKEELKRTKLEDSLSRTKLQKVYDKDIMPHPNTYVYRFGSWEKTLELAGYEYNGMWKTWDSAREWNKGKRYASTWSNMKKEEIIQAILNDLDKHGIRTSTDYNRLRDKEKTPSLVTLKYLTGLKWSDIFKIHKEQRKKQLI